MSNEKQFERLAAGEPGKGRRAPASLKARLYTAMVREQQSSGALASVTETKQGGRKLCVFEELVQIAPVGQTAKRQFICTTCHARLLAEHMDDPPIWWPNCPYAQFKGT